MNLYGFAGGDRINFGDPLGLCPSFWNGYKDTPGEDCSKREVESRTVRAVSPGQVTGAMSDFARNYHDMCDANTIGADKYFHAKANCQAAQRGPLGFRAATALSNARELADHYLPKRDKGTNNWRFGDPQSASDADQAANRAGRAAGIFNPAGSCSDMVGSFRPNGLPPNR